MSMLSALKEQWDTLDDKVIELLANTKVEIYALATIGAMALTIPAHMHEDKRSSYQEASFSEYEQIEDRAIAQGTSLPNLWWYYVDVNEYNNKVFEANNLGRDGKILPEDRRRGFATKLEQAIDTSGRIHRRNITDFAKMIPQHARGALVELQPLRDASARAANARNLVDASWDHNTRESGHQEPYDCSTTDSKGNREPKTCYRYECDYVKHTWTFTPRPATQALHALTEAKVFLPDVPTIVLPVAQETKAWNEQVIRDAFKRQAGRDPTQAEMLERAQRFAKGSQYMTNQPAIRGAWREVTNGRRRTWGEELPKMETSDYTSYSCSYNVEGPRGYELAQEIEAQLTDIVNREQAITRPMVDAIQFVPTHFKALKEFFLVMNPHMTAHVTDINPKQITRGAGSLERTAINGSRTMYITNIPGGNEPTGYRLVIPMLAAMLGIGLGAAAGFRWNEHNDEKYAHLKPKRRDEGVVWEREDTTSPRARNYRSR